MAERLTGKDIRNTTILKVDKDNMYIYNTTTEDGEEETVISCDAITKLGKLEDILEKYGIESVEVIDGILEKYFSDTWITVTPKIMKNWELISDIIASDKLSRDFELGIARDRDTWQKACELACKWFKQTGFIGDQTKVDYFYQQAKKEGENK